MYQCQQLMIPNGIEICFIVDISETMAAYVPGIISSIKDLTKIYYGIDISFIGYRDIYDLESSVFIEFIRDPHVLNQKLSRIKAVGGGQKTRNVSEAYYFAQTLEWISNKKIVFHFGDAPPYGSKYHDPAYPDNFVFGHPGFELETQVKRLAHDNINLVVFRLNKHMDKMIDIIGSSYASNRKVGFRVVEMPNINFLTSALQNIIANLPI